MPGGRASRRTGARADARDRPCELETPVDGDAWRGSRRMWCERTRWDALLSNPARSLPPPGVIRVPFGNRRPSAATVALPPGSTRTSTVSAGSAPAIRSKPKLPTYTRLAVDDHVVEVPAAVLAQSACTTGSPPGGTPAAFPRRGRLTQRAPDLVRPLQGGEVGVGEGHSVLVDLGREVPALVLDDGGQQLTLDALAAQQRRLDLIRERQLGQHGLHRRVQQRVGDREQPDGEQALALLVRRRAAHHLAHAGAQEGERDQVVRRVRDG